ncbi:hypothetical protein LCGC14_1890740 [marine sediment metagenome]|uniref:Glycosyltransferase 2-like domain-containing protein n=1 Tax=marine sediment metagenome TaxID=412755 RepID=A0A0F9IXS1_9ZZZZ
MAYYNRKPQLLKTLDSINESTIKEFEIIIVDDGSTPEHRLDEEELHKHCDCNINLVEIDRDLKTWINPCMAHNIAFSLAKGDKVVIQNPETYHMGDILAHVNAHLLPTTYLTYRTIALNEPDTNGMPTKINVPEIASYMIPIINNTSAVKGNPHVGQTIWYNHAKYRPVHYHFISAMTKENLHRLGGFDERYKDGRSYDDNEFLIRIDRLGLKKLIINDPMAIHLYHPLFSSLSEGTNNADIYRNITLKEKDILIQKLDFNNYVRFLKK